MADARSVAECKLLTSLDFAADGHFAHHRGHWAKDGRRATEVGVAVHALNRMLELGRPISVRVA